MGGPDQPDLQARYRGALLGLAAGDALGTTLEFSPPGSFEPIDDMLGGGPFSLEPGQWTDDTSMALCLAESLLEREGFDAVDQLERYVCWWKEGYLSSTGTCFDIGNTTRLALQRFARTHETFPGPTDERSAGNGSLMRLAPVPLAFAFDADKTIRRAASSSATTHGARAAVDACRYMASLFVGVLAGAPKTELLSPRFTPIPGYWEQHPLCPEVDAVAGGGYRYLEPPVIQGSGFVVRSLEAALWAFHRTDGFREGALLAVNLGDDADTTGAVYGQLAGAFYGEAAIPEAWRDKLARRSTIIHFADRLLALRRTLEAESQPEIPASEEEETEQAEEPHGVR